MILQTLDVFFFRYVHLIVIDATCSAEMHFKIRVTASEKISYVE